MPIVTTMRADLPASPLFQMLPGSRCQREAVPEHLLEKSIEQGRRAPVPQRVEEDEVIGLADRLLRGVNRFRRLRFLEILLGGSQQREIELRATTIRWTLSPASSAAWA